MQAGTSAPGGLVNLVVKRPDRRAAAQRAPRMAPARQRARRGRPGPTASAPTARSACASTPPHEHLDPPCATRDGHRRAAGAGRRLAPRRATRCSRPSSRQPPVASRACPASACSATRVPDAPIDPRLNLNNQPWSHAGRCSTATPASLRFTQALGDGWRCSSRTRCTQRLRTRRPPRLPVRLHAPRGNFDRYCTDGTLRPLRLPQRERAPRAATRSTWRCRASATHRRAGARPARSACCAARQRDRFQARRPSTSPAPATSTARAVTPPTRPASPTATRNRDERSTELYLRDAIRFDDAHRALWLGLRHTRLRPRAASAPTAARADGVHAVAHHAVAGAQLRSSRRALTGLRELGPGLETRGGAEPADCYSNAGAAAAGAEEPPGRARRQGATRRARRWQLAAFDIDAAACRDIGTCCTRRRLRHARRRQRSAIAASRPSAAWRTGPWLAARAARCCCDARREGTADAALNGQRPTNVPARSAASCRRRTRSPRCPAWRSAPRCHARGPPRGAARQQRSHRRLDARRPAARAGAHDWRGTTLTWRVGIDNVFDRRAWQEAPVPVRPRLPVPAGAAHAAPLAAGRALRTPRSHAIIRGLFLDSSVGRAPDC